MEMPYDYLLFDESEIILRREELWQPLHKEKL